MVSWKSLRNLKIWKKEIKKIKEISQNYSITISQYWKKIKKEIKS